MKVKSTNCLSQPFQVSNGGRHESILSSHLFAIYLDNFSHELNKVRAGCIIGNAKFNRIFYADGLWWFCPSVLKVTRLNERLCQIRCAS